MPLLLPSQSLSHTKAQWREQKAQTANEMGPLPEALSCWGLDTHTHTHTIHRDAFAHTGLWATHEHFC